MITLDDFKKFDFRHISTKDFFDIEVLLTRLILERDAYRKVAVLGAYDPWSHGEKHFTISPAEKEVDAEAKRILDGD